MQPSSSFSVWDRIKIRVICRVAWLLVWAVNSTVRMQTRHLDKLEQAAGQGGVIFSFYHNQIFSWSHAARFRKIVVITSRHFDGEYIARMIRLFGFGASRGSSTRGAVPALLELKRLLEGGTDVAFTIDGPRGPRYKVKPGPLWLSQRTGFPVLPVHIQPRSYWQLKSWDRFRIPKPFTPVLTLFGDPFVVPAQDDPRDWLPVFQEAMDSLRHCADTFDWSDFRANWNSTKNRSYSYRTPST